MKNSKHTKGEWNYDINANKGFDIFVKDTIKTIANVLHKDVSYMPTEEEAIANCKLIVDAANTTTKSGLLPSELLEQRDELMEALIELSKLVKAAGHELWLEHSGSNNAIAKATK